MADEESLTIKFNDADLLRYWNNARMEINAFIMQFAFRKIQNNDDVSLHNFAIDIMAARIGIDNRERFLNSMAQCITDYSMEGLKDVEKKKDSGT